MIDKVTIGFSKPRNRLLPVGSWAIRFFQQTPYSHTYVRFHSQSIDRTLIYESVGTGGVRFVGYKLWHTHAEEIKAFTLSADKINIINMLQTFVDECGTDYGYLQNIGIALADLFGWKNNPWRNGKNCSEIVAEFLISEGYSFSKPLDLITPKDIYNILSK